MYRISLERSPPPSTIPTAQCPLFLLPVLSALAVTTLFATVMKNALFCWMTAPKLSPLPICLSRLILSKVLNKWPVRTAAQSMNLPSGTEF